MIARWAPYSAPSLTASSSARASPPGAAIPIGREVLKVSLGVCQRFEGRNHRRPALPRPSTFEGGRVSLWPCDARKGGGRTSKVSHFGRLAVVAASAAPRRGFPR